MKKIIFPLLLLAMGNAYGQKITGIDKEDKKGVITLTAKLQIPDAKITSSATYPSSNTNRDTIHCNCPPGFVVTGYKSKTGSLIDGIVLKCSPYRNGIVGGLTSATKNIGGPGGDKTAEFDTVGMIMRSVKIETGSDGYFYRITSNWGSANLKTEMLFSKIISGSNAPSKAINTVNVSQPNSAVVGAIGAKKEGYIDLLGFNFMPLSAFNDYTVQWSDGSAGPVIQVYKSGTYTARLLMGKQVIDSFSFPITLSASQSEDPLYIDKNGNVGIGTSSPTNPLTVIGNTNIMGNLSLGESSSTNRLSVNGNANINGSLDISGELRVGGKPIVSPMPQGAIIMYSGKTALFDNTGLGLKGQAVEDWAICNGQNGTPDLRNRFIVGAGVGESQYKMGDQGGIANHSFDTHALADYTFGRNDGTFIKKRSSDGDKVEIENRPPYYALVYLMKL